jgi:hypothetical protein
MRRTSCLGRDDRSGNSNSPNICACGILGNWHSVHFALPEANGEAVRGLVLRCVAPGVRYLTRWLFIKYQISVDGYLWLDAAVVGRRGRARSRRPAASRQGRQPRVDGYLWPDAAMVMPPTSSRRIPLAGCRYRMPPGEGTRPSSSCFSTRALTSLTSSYCIRD